MTWCTQSPELVHCSSVATKEGDIVMAWSDGFSDNLTWFNSQGEHRPGAVLSCADPPAHCVPLISSLSFMGVRGYP